MDIQLKDVKDYVEGLVDAAGGARELAGRIGVSHQTIYNVMGGGWPSKAIADALGLRLVVPPARIRNHILHPKVSNIGRKRMP